MFPCCQVTQKPRQKVTQHTTPTLPLPPGQKTSARSRKRRCGALNPLTHGRDACVFPTRAMQPTPKRHSAPSSGIQMPITPLHDWGLIKPWHMKQASGTPPLKQRHSHSSFEKTISSEREKQDRMIRIHGLHFSLILNHEPISKPSMPSIKHTEASASCNTLLRLHCSRQHVC